MSHKFIWADGLGTFVSISFFHSLMWFAETFLSWMWQIENLVNLKKKKKKLATNFKIRLCNAIYTVSHLSSFYNNHCHKVQICYVVPVHIYPSFLLLSCFLQPLSDNLESQTYEIFEKDPVKYTRYQEAVYKALLDRVSDSEKETRVT